MLINSTGYFVLAWSVLLAWIAAVAGALLLGLLRRRWAGLIAAVLLLAAGLAARRLFLGLIA